MRSPRREYSVWLAWIRADLLEQVACRHTVRPLSLHLTRERRWRTMAHVSTTRRAPMIRFRKQLIAAVVFVLLGMVGTMMNSHKAAAAGSAPVTVMNTSSNPVVTASEGTTTVSGTVAVSNFPATQAVTGTVGVNNYPATQNVS